MNKIITIFTLLLSVSCQEISDSKTNSEVFTDSCIVEPLEHIDTVKEVFNSRADSFLTEPFDLYDFKSKKNGSLSGGAYFKNYHFKPDLSGIGYRFFMFEPKKVNYIRDGKEMRHPKVGFIGKNKSHVSFKDDGLIIKTFQPNDKYKNKYLNPNETLIELIATYNDFDLPELAFVGLDSISVKKQLGRESFYKNDCLVYSKNNIALILKLNHSRVMWVKYILLAKEIEFESDINDLYNLE